MIDRNRCTRIKTETIADGDECCVNCCLMAVNFFGFLQHLYTFFSKSTHRWGVLKDNNAHLADLSDTRWSCRKDAVKNLCKNYPSIHNALKTLSADVDQKAGRKQNLQ